MINAEQEFNRRAAEIDRFFQLLEKIESEHNILYDAKQTSPFPIDDDLFKMLKANGFLLLYNLIESTILNCVSAIFDQLSLKNYSYKEVTENVRKYWLKYQYKHDDKIKKQTVINQFYSISESVLNGIIISIQIEKIDSAGTLDTEKIKKLAEDLGVAVTMNHFDMRKHGESFKAIKRHRNDLAHGKNTFTDIGKDITFYGDQGDGTKGLGLIHFKQYTIEHLQAFMNNVKDYITNEEYLIQLAPAVAPAHGGI